jgi:ribosomal protein S18 acetylase RimI-like enzyme
MELRPVTLADLTLLSEIDGTIASTDYLHVERSGEGFAATWKLHERPLRERLVRSNPIDEERAFDLKSIVSGANEGIALMAEHDGVPVALAAAMPDPSRGVLRILELRVDFDQRRQGLGSALLYKIIHEARTRELRAVMAETTTDNHPANLLFLKCGFEIAGLDERRSSNHDLVKESVTLIWYASLD